MRKTFTTVMCILIGMAGAAVSTAYGKGNDSLAASEKAFAKRFEQAVLQLRKQVDLGSLECYKTDLVAGIEKQHPDFTHLKNLGKLPKTAADKKSLAQTEECYLLEVREGNEFFYYEVTLGKIFRVPSDVIPAHVSAVSVVVKPIGTAELTKLLKSLSGK